MLKDDVLAAFMLEYESEIGRLQAATASAQPDRAMELAQV
jgi:hypothetical protein